MQPDIQWALQPLNPMSTAEFDNWCRLLEERSGIVWHEERKSYLEVRLSARMRELGVESYNHYYQQVLQGASGSLEWTRLLDGLTVQETRFFRHLPSYQFACEYMRQRLRSGQGDLSLWSAGCSTGEEAWSLAIMADEALRLEGASGSFSVMATDISRTALATARQGSYSATRTEPVEPELLQRYFQQETSGRFRVVEALRRRLCFSWLNLQNLSQAPLSDMDLIFCQNVLIYFRRWQRRDILNQLAARLVPGGVLVLGLGEITGWEHPDLVAVDNDQILAFVRKG